jgi:hypothetical protein
MLNSRTKKERKKDPPPRMISLQAVTLVHIDLLIDYSICQWTTDLQWCTVQFHSILHGLWPVTQNTDSALRQPTKFSVTPPKVWHSRQKFQKFCLFCTSKGDLATMSRILHSALGAVTRDQDQNSSWHRECMTRWNSALGCSHVI